MQHDKKVFPLNLTNNAETNTNDKVGCNLENGMLSKRHQVSNKELK
jgi:hypothetical protein